MIRKNKICKEIFNFIKLLSSIFVLQALRYPTIQGRNIAEKIYYKY